MLTELFFLVWLLPHIYYKKEVFNVLLIMVIAALQRINPIQETNKIKETSEGIRKLREEVETDTKNSKTPLLDIVEK